MGGRRIDLPRQLHRRKGARGRGPWTDHRGHPVVDLWGGWFDTERSRSYDRDTLQVVFSTGKAVVATAVAIALGVTTPSFSR